MDTPSSDASEISGIDTVEAARLFATAAHGAIGQRRKYLDTPYIEHPAAVAALVSRHCPGEPAMVAAAWGGAADADVVVLLIEAHRGITKGVRAILAHRGLDAADAIGIGDSWNDREMFDVVGTSVVMGQADPELQRHADQVTASVAEDGVATALARLGLIDPA